MADKKKQQNPGPTTPAGYHAKLAADIDASLTKDECAALDTLTKNGWCVMLQPRVENCTTAHGLRSFQGSGRYRVGVVKDRIMR